jgi:hypothetical protein
MVLSALLACALPAPPQNVKAFYIGHSLATDIPDFVASLARQRNYPFSFKDQNFPGAPLHMQWDEPKKGRKLDPQFSGFYDKCLREGVNVFVLTDSVPRGDEWTVNDTIEQLTKFAGYAKSVDPNMRMYYYEGWHCLNTGTPKGCDWDKTPNLKYQWVERTKVDHAMWSRIVNTVNRKGYHVKMIPAGLAWHNLAKAIEARQVPGINSHRELFVDDIHASVLGRVFVSMVHFATIYRESPEGIGSKITDRWTRNVWKDKRFDKVACPEPSPATMRALAKVAWDTVRNEPLAGI